MSIRKAEELADTVYRKWQNGCMSTKRARSLLSRLPHTYHIDLIWGVISYF